TTRGIHDPLLTREERVGLRGDFDLDHRVFLAFELDRLGGRLRGTGEERPARGDVLDDDVFVFRMNSLFHFRRPFLPLAATAAIVSAAETAAVMAFVVVSAVVAVAIGDRDESQLAGALHFGSQLTLLLAVEAIDPSRDHAAAFGEERLDGFDVLIVDDEID